jgi:hypothetical protein
MAIAAICIQSCSSVKKKSVITRAQNNQIKSSLPPKFENFDLKPFPNESFIIANMITVVQPELTGELRDTYATYISRAMSTYKIEPQIIVAIIDTESDFNPDKVSTTGDLSLAQINVNMWNKEFIRMKMKPMDKKKLRENQQYALMKMGEILSIIKKRYGKQDRRWYARYHSNTHKYKKNYLYKLEVRMRLLAMSKNLNSKMAQSF